MFLINVFIKKLMKEVKNIKHFTPIADALFLIRHWYKYLSININIMVTSFNFIIILIILFSLKKSVQLSIYSLVSCPKKLFSTLSAKTLPFNVNYSNTPVFTFHLYNCQVTKSNNRCNQIEVLLRRDFRLKSLTKYCIQA